MLSKTFEPTDVGAVADLKVIAFKFVQPLKALAPKLVISFKPTSTNPIQFSNAFAPIVFTFANSICTNLVLPLNELAPIFVTFVKSTLAKLTQFSNAFAPSVEIVVSKSTEVNASFSLNAPVPIVVAPLIFTEPIKSQS